MGGGAGGQFGSRKLLRGMPLLSFLLDRCTGVVGGAEGSLFIVGCTPRSMGAFSGELHLGVEDGESMGVWQGEFNFPCFHEPCISS